MGVGDVGFLENVLWVPMLRKYLISESQLAGDDNLRVSKEQGPLEAIVYSGNIFRDFKVAIKTHIKDPHNRLYDVSQSYFWDSRRKIAVLVNLPTLNHLSGAVSGKTTI